MSVSLVWKGRGILFLVIRNRESVVFSPTLSRTIDAVGSVVDSVC